MTKKKAKDFLEERVRQQYEQSKTERIEKSLLDKSLFEEAASCYLHEDYRAAFLIAYVDLVAPIAINARRLHKKKRRKDFFSEEDAYRFNYINDLEDCIFLSDEHTLKKELSKKYSVLLKYPKKSKVEDLTLHQIRNIIVHPEDNRHNFTINSPNIKGLSLKILYLALLVHRAYNIYLSDIESKHKRKDKETVVYQRICRANAK